MDRRVLPVPSRAPREPLGVAPFVRARRDDARGGARSMLVSARVGIGLQEDAAARAMAYLVLVERADWQLRDEQLPHAARAAVLHRVRATVPVVEVADHGHALCVRRPHREAYALRAGDLDRIRAERVVGLEELPRSEKVQIEIRDRRRERVGIDDLANELAFLDAQPAGRRRRRRSQPFEIARAQMTSHRLPVGADHDVHLLRARLERAIGPARAGPVRPQQRERLVQARREQPVAQAGGGIGNGGKRCVHGSGMIVPGRQLWATLGQASRNPWRKRRVIRGVPATRTA